MTPAIGPAPSAPPVNEYRIFSVCACATWVKLKVTTSTRGSCRYRKSRKDENCLVEVTPRSAFLGRDNIALGLLGVRFACALQVRKAAEFTDFTLNLFPRSRGHHFFKNPSN